MHFTQPSLRTLCTVRTLTWRAPYRRIFHALFTHFLRTFCALFTHFAHFTQFTRTFRTFYAFLLIFAHFSSTLRTLRTLTWRALYRRIFYALFTHFLRTFCALFTSFYALCALDPVYSHFLRTFCALFAHFVRTLHTLPSLSTLCTVRTRCAPHYVHYCMLGLGGNLNNELES